MGTATFIFKTIDVLTNLLMNPSHIKDVTCITKDQYDLYYLDDQVPKPILVNIHGGGFLAGDKKYRRYWCEVLAKNNWFVINVNYRLCPTVTIIDQIKDVWAIIQQINDIAAEYQVDPKTIAISGDSAGAFLAAYMVALTTNKDLQQKLGIEEKNKIRFCGALLFCGVYDFESLVKTQRSPYKASIIKDIAQSLTGLKFKNLDEIKNYKFFDLLCIPRFVNKHWCPVQIFFSQKDLFVKGQGELFYRALKQQGVPVRQHSTSKLWQNHCYHLFFLTSVSKSSLKITKEFLDGIRRITK